MSPTKHICRASSPLSPPPSTLESLTWIKPSDYEQPIKSTFTSVTLPALTTSEPYTSPHLVWVQVPEMESKAPQSVVQDLPFLEAESPATTGIEAYLPSKFNTILQCSEWLILYVSALYQCMELLSCHALSISSESHYCGLVLLASRPGAPIAWTKINWLMVSFPSITQLY